MNNKSAENLWTYAAGASARQRVERGYFQWSKLKGSKGMQLSQSTVRCSQTGTK